MSREKKPERAHREPAERAASGGGLPPANALARRVVRDLRLLCLRLLDEATGGRLRPEEIETLAVQLPVEIAGKDLHRRMRERAEGIVRTLRDEIGEIAKNRLAFHPGRVYCYWCESSACEHSIPESPLDVFLGYHPTGRPRWGEFASLCLARGDARTSGLFRSRPEILAVVMTEEEMKGEQLPAFGRSSRVFNILGQVCAGHFLGRSRGGETPSRVALSFQFVESRRLGGGPGVEINVVVGSPDVDDPLGLLVERDAEILDDLVRKTHERLAATVRRARRERSERIPREAIAPVLTWLARGIEHIYRQHERRTKHARERATDVRRPTQKALEEAVRVHPERLQADVENGTFIVLGARGRVHVYSVDGKHVTSLSLQAEAIQKRIGSGRWRPATQDEWTEFRRVLAARNPHDRGSEPMGTSAPA